MTENTSEVFALDSIEENFKNLESAKKDLAEAKHLLHRVSSLIATIELLNGETK